MKKTKPTQKAINAGTKNLIPLPLRSEEEQRAIRKKAAEAKAEKAWEDKMLQKCLKLALLAKNPATGNKYIVDVAAAIVMKASVEGDAKEFNAIRDLLGEKPVDKTEDVTDVSDILARARRRLKVKDDEDSSR